MLGNYGCLGYPFQGLRVTRLKRRPLLVLPGGGKIYTSTHFLDGENRKTLGKFKKIIIINLQGINYFIHCHFTNLSLNVFEEDSDSLYFPTIEMVWLSEVTTMLPRRQMPSVIPGRPGLAFGPLMNGTNALPEYPWSFDGIWTWIGACRQAKMRVKGKDLNQTWTGCQVRKSYSGWLLVPFE